MKDNKSKIKELKFSYDYPKLDSDVFTTLRKHTDLNEGDIALVITPSRKFKARVLFSSGVLLESLSDELLCYDTDKSTREDALKLLQSFYRTDIKDTEFWLLILRKTEETSKQYENKIKELEKDIDTKNKYLKADEVQFRKNYNEIKL